MTNSAQFQGREVKTTASARLRSSTWALRTAVSSVAMAAALGGGVLTFNVTLARAAETTIQAATAPSTTLSTSATGYVALQDAKTATASTSSTVDNAIIDATGVVSTGTGAGSVLTTVSSNLIQSSATQNQTETNVNVLAGTGEIDGGAVPAGVGAGYGVATVGVVDGAAATTDADATDNLISIDLTALVTGTATVGENTIQALATGSSATNIVGTQSGDATAGDVPVTLSDATLGSIVSVPFDGGAPGTTLNADGTIALSNKQVNDAGAVTAKLAGDNESTGTLFNDATLGGGDAGNLIEIVGTPTGVQALNSTISAPRNTLATQSVLNTATSSILLTDGENPTFTGSAVLSNDQAAFAPNNLFPEADPESDSLNSASVVSVEIGSFDDGTSAADRYNLTGDVSVDLNEISSLDIGNTARNTISLAGLDVNGPAAAGSDAEAVAFSNNTDAAVDTYSAASGDLLINNSQIYSYAGADSIGRSAETLDALVKVDIQSVTAGTLSVSANAITSELVGQSAVNTLSATGSVTFAANAAVQSSQDIISALTGAVTEDSRVMVRLGDIFNTTVFDTGAPDFTPVDGATYDGVVTTANVDMADNAIASQTTGGSATNALTIGSVDVDLTFSGLTGATTAAANLASLTSDTGGAPGYVAGAAGALVQNLQNLEFFLLGAESRDNSVTFSATTVGDDIFALDLDLTGSRLTSQATGLTTDAATGNAFTITANTLTGTAAVNSLQAVDLGSVIATTQNNDVTVDLGGTTRAGGFGSNVQLDTSTITVDGTAIMSSATGAFARNAGAVDAAAITVPTDGESGTSTSTTGLTSSVGFNLYGALSLSGGAAQGNAQFGVANLQDVGATTVQSVTTNADITVTAYEDIQDSSSIDLTDSMITATGYAARSDNDLTVDGTTITGPTTGERFGVLSSLGNTQNVAGSAVTASVTDALFLVTTVELDADLDNSRITIGATDPNVPQTMQALAVGAAATNTLSVGGETASISVLTLDDPTLGGLFYSDGVYSVDSGQPVAFDPLDPTSTARTFDDGATIQLGGDGGYVDITVDGNDYERQLAVQALVAYGQANNLTVSVGSNSVRLTNNTGTDFSFAADLTATAAEVDPSIGRTFLPGFATLGTSNNENGGASGEAGDYDIESVTTEQGAYAQLGNVLQNVQRLTASTVTATVGDAAGNIDGAMVVIQNDVETSSSIKIDSNAFQAIANGNTATNELDIGATSLATTAGLQNVQSGNPDIVSEAGVTGAENNGVILVEIMAEPGTISDSTLAVTNNDILGESIANSAVNTLAATGGTSITSDGDTVGVANTSARFVLADFAAMNLQSYDEGIIDSTAVARIRSNTVGGGELTAVDPLDTVVNTVSDNSVQTTAIGNTAQTTLTVAGASDAAQTNAGQNAALLSIQRYGLDPLGNIVRADQTTSDSDLQVMLQASAVDSSTVTADGNDAVATTRGNVGVNSATLSGLTLEQASNNTVNAGGSDTEADASATLLLVSLQDARGPTSLTVGSGVTGADFSARAKFDAFNEDYGTEGTEDPAYWISEGLANSTLSMSANQAVASANANRAVNATLADAGSILDAPSALASTQFADVAVDADAAGTARLALRDDGEATLSDATVTLSNNLSEATARQNIAANTAQAEGVTVNAVDYGNLTGAGRADIASYNVGNATDGSVGTFAATTNTGSVDSWGGVALANRQTANDDTDATAVGLAKVELDGVASVMARTSTVTLQSNRVEATASANRADNEVQMTGSSLLAGTGALGSTVENFGDVTARAENTLSVDGGLVTDIAKFMELGASVTISGDTTVDTDYASRAVARGNTVLNSFDASGTNIQGIGGATGAITANASDNAGNEAYATFAAGSDQMNQGDLTSTAVVTARVAIESGEYDPTSFLITDSQITVTDLDALAQTASNYAQTLMSISGTTESAANAQSAALVNRQVDYFSSATASATLTASAPAASSTSSIAITENDAVAQSRRNETVNQITATGVELLDFVNTGTASADAYAEVTNISVFDTALAGVNFDDVILVTGADTSGGTPPVVSSTYSTDPSVTGVVGEATYALASFQRDFFDVSTAYDPLGGSDDTYAYAGRFSGTNRAITTVDIGNADDATLAGDGVLTGAGVLDGSVLMSDNTGTAEAINNRAVNALTLEATGGTLSASGALTNGQFSAASTDVDVDMDVTLRLDGEGVTIADTASLRVVSNTAQAIARNNLASNSVTASGSTVAGVADTTAATLQATSQIGVAALDDAKAAAGYSLLNVQDANDQIDMVNEARTNVTSVATAISDFVIGLDEDGSPSVSETAALKAASASALDLSSNVTLATAVINEAANTMTVDASSVNAATGALGNFQINRVDATAQVTANHTMNLGGAETGTGGSVLAEASSFELENNVAIATSRANLASNVLNGLTGADYTNVNGATGTAASSGVLNNTATLNGFGAAEGSAQFALASVQYNEARIEATITGEARMTMRGENSAGAPVGQVLNSAARVSGNRFAANAFANTAINNSLTVSDIQGGTASSALTSSQVNTGVVVASATNIDIGITANQASVGVSSMRVVGNSITATSVGNTSVSRVSAVD